MQQKDHIRIEYIKRINNIIDYVEKNLEKELPLEYLSKIACFSPFHFHRIFSAITGETLNAFVNRKRIERIAATLMTDSATPISELALQYGFNSGSAFSRAFKKFYGVSPSEFQEKSKGKYSKIGISKRKNGEGHLTFDQYICSINNIKNWIKMNAQIEVKEMPEFKLACVKHTGAFDKIGEAYETLMKWAGPKGLLSMPNMKMATIYHDNPKVTELSKIRQSASMTIANDVIVEGEIAAISIEKGRYAVGRFEISNTEFQQAWDSMCVWVVEGGYQYRDGDYFELYHNDHRTHPEQKFILDICIPVK